MVSVFRSVASLPARNFHVSPQCHHNLAMLFRYPALGVQVDLEQNRPALEAALVQASNEDVTVVVFPDANHLFQQAETGAPQEYATLEPEFLPGFLETISGWLLARVEPAG